MSKSLQKRLTNVHFSSHIHTAYGMSALGEQDKTRMKEVKLEIIQYSDLSLTSSIPHEIDDVPTNACSTHANFDKSGGRRRFCRTAYGIIPWQPITNNPSAADGLNFLFDASAKLNETTEAAQPSSPQPVCTRSLRALDNYYIYLFTHIIMEKYLRTHAPLSCSGFFSCSALKTH